MKIEIKKVKYFPEKSGETLAFAAILCINGKATGICGNDGDGTATYYSALHDTGEALIHQADRFFEGQPPRRLHIRGIPKAMEIPRSLGLEIYRHARLMLARDKRKDEKRIAATLHRYQIQAIVYGKPDGLMRCHALPYPLSDILSHPILQIMLTHFLEKEIAPKLSKGDQVLNNNIPESVYRQAGLKPHQYRPQPVRRKHQKHAGKKSRRP